MSSAIDPATGRPLPANAIQRVLFVGANVHVYQIPPLASTRGYAAAAWTVDPRKHIFTARLRILETGVDDDTDADDNVTVAILLEDPASGQLFAAAPYTDAGVVEPALDSARFFALRVQDGQGRRAVLGIGFEERPDAFDFGVALQEARKTLGRAAAAAAAAAAGSSSAAPPLPPKTADADTRDYRLKEGETITINLGSSSRFGNRGKSSTAAAATANSSGSLASFALPPPPPPPSSSSSAFSLPPPPPPNRRTANRQSVGNASALGALGGQSGLHEQDSKQASKQTAADLGFDDGQFGEFA